MKKSGLLALFLLPAACSKTPAAPEQKGRGLYLSMGCRACHKIGDEGGAGGPDLTYVGFRKTAAWLDLWLRDPRAWKKDTLMPNQLLSEEARRDLVAYLSTLKGQGFAGNPPWAVETDPVKTGRILFNRAGCVACHGQGGRGGYPNNNVAGGRIPALDKVSESYTKAELAAKIKRGAKPQKADVAGPDPLIFMPPWGEVLKDGEIENVAAYLFSLHPGSPTEKEW